MRRLGTTLTLGLVATSAGSAVASEPAASYSHSFQRLHGQPATFFVSGPATGGSPDVEGDANLESVEYASGDVFYFFYKPVEVYDVAFTGDATQWSVLAGARTTTDVRGRHMFADYDDSPTAVDQFGGLMLQAMNNNNLNNYVDLNSSSPRFSFTIAFDRVVKDNDENPDDFGELLYLERGAGYGNSWLKIQAVDEDGNALGPWLVLSPAETVQTSPVTTVYRMDQKMGCTSIDVSRLGVTGLQHLRVSNDLPGEPAYTGGGDLNPDFKIMAVITDTDQLENEVLGTFD